MYKILTIVILGCQLLSAQNVSWEELSPMPSPITNNAVTGATVNDTAFVFSFAGMDTTKACGHAQLTSFKYNTVTDQWSTIADLPDELDGVVAAGASTIQNEVYIAGGYHIRDNCSEVSSNSLHRYNPETDTYTKLANIPIAIDDHVQTVYKDSLLYIITGWSNTTNVVQVQIYDPTTDTWSMGTPVKTSPDWRVFGASGVIFQNTIYYAGGASLTCNNSSCFAPTTLLRIGQIDENEPTEITWTSIESPIAQGYRMASVASNDNMLWIGGSDLTYNFDGIDYNGTGGVAPSTDLKTLNTSLVLNLGIIENVLPPVMDLRGIAKLDKHNFIICGGMTPGQKVTDKAYKITVMGLTTTDTPSSVSWDIFPNPATDHIKIVSTCSDCKYSITDSLGREVTKGKVTEQVDISHLDAGNYMLRIVEANAVSSSKQLVIVR